MAITYSAPNGTRITSPAMNEALGSQTQQTGNNTVVVSDTPTNAGNGQIGDGTNGVGNIYAGRLIAINIGTGSEQVRLCTGEVGGTGTTRILTVDSDWDTNPVATTDTIYVAYELADIEDGGVGNGINLNSKSGLWELSNTLEILSTGLFYASKGAGMELDDQGATYGFQVQSGGYFYAGYENPAGLLYSGIQLISYNNTDAEPSTEILSGGYAKIVDSLVWAQLNTQVFDVQDGATAVFKLVKFLFVSEELILYNSDITNCSAEGRVPATTEIVRVDADTTCNGFTLSLLYGIDSRADTVTETIELWGVVYITDRDYIRVRNNKTWDMVDPVWPVTAHGDFNWIGSTSNRVNDRRSVTAVVQEPDGTLLQDALINIYEDTQTGDLVLEMTTDVDGYAQGTFIFREFITNSTTNTFGGHAFQAGKWLYLPFVAAQASDEKFDGTVTLIDDPNIVETTQATAKSDGSTITWNEDTNPSELVEFSAGSGTLVDGMIVTFTPSGAIGTISSSMSGDSTAGEFHLHTRNATAIANGDTFSRTGGAAGTFSGTYTNNSKQPFSIWIDGQDLGMQVIYDYLAAIQNETTLTTDGELIWEWCRSAQSQPLYSLGSSWFTERSNSKGIIVVDGGAGTQDYYTDDAGVQWVPPVSLTITLTPLVAGSVASVYLEGTNVLVAENLNTGTSWAFSAQASTAYDIVVLESTPDTNDGHIPIRNENVSFTVSQNFPVNQLDAPNYSG